VKKRAGAPIPGTVVNDGTAGDADDPRVWLFDRPVSPCIVTSHTAAFKSHEVSVKVNTEIPGSTPEPFTQAAGLGHFVLPTKRTEANLWRAAKEGGEVHLDVSCGGQIAVHSVSVSMIGTMADISVVGFDG